MQEAEICKSVSFEPQAAAPTGSEHDVHLDFTVDIVEDVAAEVEEVMRLSAFGLFGEARKAADETLRPHLGPLIYFPIAAEFLRLLYDQGDFDMLRQEAEKLHRGDGQLQDALPGDLELLLLLCDIRNLGSEVPLREDLGSISRQIYRIHNTTYFKDDVYWADMEGRRRLRSLLLKATERLCAVRMGISSEQLHAPPTMKPWPLLSCLVQDFLAKGQYWLAEKSLELCFWPYEYCGHVLPTNTIWELIGSMIDVSLGSDEGNILGRIGVLLSFCEGVLRRGEPQSTYWVLASGYLAEAALDMTRLYPSLQSAWSRSRATIRRQLLDFDHSLAEDNARAIVMPTTKCITILRALEVHAADESDLRMSRVVRSRISLLSDDVDANTAPIERLDTLLPLCIYRRRRELLGGQAKHESRPSSLVGWSHVPSMASHITTDGQVLPPLNISAPAPVIDLRGFKWTTVDRAINMAQRLKNEYQDPSAKDGPFGLPQHRSEADAEAELHLPAQVEKPFGTNAVPPPPLPPPPLTKFQGSYAGNGFNTIFRPRSNVSSEDSASDLPNRPIDLGGLPDDNILELNLTTEQLTFGSTIGNIPNRGLYGQPDITLAGLPYLQTVQDVTNVLTGLGDRTSRDDIHFESGVWLHVPGSTLNPKIGSSVVRMACIPHGTTINAQGLAPMESGDIASGGNRGGPFIDDIDITPSLLADGKTIQFPSMLSRNKFSPRIPQDLDKFNEAGTITDEIIRNPNLVLRNANHGQTISETISLEVSAGPPPPLTMSRAQPTRPRTHMLNGGGITNIAFLQGQQELATQAVPTPAMDNPNACATSMTSKFWIETVQYKVNVGVMTSRDPVLLYPTMPKGSTAPTPMFLVTPPRKLPSLPKTITIAGTQIQYSQQVNLVFGGLSRPHVSVATLVPTEPQPFTMPG
ncbi:hypothetical protein LTR10_012293 [Elasticomyces elasticus]|nr:hypothetical protein LTR10_012293 [Elasticomyces elasticus]KAK4965769.1 hypothetical protein LTR42_011782 [Elasticomyces elasticus]